MKEKNRRASSPRGRRQKGSSFERKVAKGFMEWWGREVKRTPLSGGWGSSQSFGTTGDLICQGGWRFVVECKCHEDWHLEGLILNDKSKMKGWWAQAKRDLLPKQVPLLVFARNHIEPLIMVRKDDWQKMMPDWEPLGSVFEVLLEPDMDVVMICPLRSFFNNVRPPKPSPNREGWGMLPERKFKLNAMKRGVR